MKFRSIIFYTHKNKHPQLFFNNVEVFNSNEKSLTALAQISISEFMYENMSFPKLVEGLTSEAFLMSLDSEDPFDKFRGVKVGVNVKNLTFIKSKRDGENIIVTVKLHIEYE